MKLFLILIILFIIWYVFNICTFEPRIYVEMVSVDNEYINGRLVDFKLRYVIRNDISFFKTRYFMYYYPIDNKVYMKWVRNAGSAEKFKKREDAENVIKDMNENPDKYVLVDAN